MPRKKKTQTLKLGHQLLALLLITIGITGVIMLTVMAVQEPVRTSSEAYDGRLRMRQDLREADEELMVQPAPSYGEPDEMPQLLQEKRKPRSY